MSYFKYQGKNVYYEEMKRQSAVSAARLPPSSNMFYGLRGSTLKHCRVIPDRFSGARQRIGPVAPVPGGSGSTKPCRLSGGVKAGGYGPVDIIGSSGGARAGGGIACTALEARAWCWGDRRQLLRRKPLKAFTQEWWRSGKPPNGTEKRHACSYWPHARRRAGNRWWTATPRRSDPAARQRPSGDSLQAVRNATEADILMMMMTGSKDKFICALSWFL